jgi:hypothetical protein
VYVNSGAIRNEVSPEAAEASTATIIASLLMLGLICPTNAGVFGEPSGIPLPARGPSIRLLYPGDKGVVPWPRPALGKWEMRDVYVIEMSRLAYASGYCYGRWVMYVEKKTLYPLTIDLYDFAGGLYKLWLGLQTPLRVPDTGAALGVNGGTELLVVTFKDKHLTVATAAHTCFNTDCNAQYLDTGRYASPQGLSKIAQ